ncbi:hypothetical protein AAHA92_21556 [Salvia divinorum]|uniref:Uncharacterized protein n=1 Tax=Salvia divinorum TaxID=28513 RepID=A0ABD1GKV3_SALDI
MTRGVFPELKHQLSEEAIARILMNFVEENEGSLAVTPQRHVDGVTELLNAGDGREGDESVGGRRGVGEGEGAGLEIYRCHERWRSGGGRRQKVGVLVLCE